jgi:hypothetical protein
MTDESNPNTLLIGIARTDITPPVGTPSAGFAGRGALAAHHDPLLATALVFSDGSFKAAWIACDLLYLDVQTVSAIRAEVERRTGIAPGSVTISCTHTHYGPITSHKSEDALVHTYRANLVQLLAGAVQEAASEMQPAYVGVGWGASDIGVNRREKLPDGRVILGRNPSGPIDRAVGVLRIDAPDGCPLACVVNFQCHPVSQTGTVDHISADFPGKMCEVVETLADVPCLYLQGATGNINASIMKPDYEPARTLGVRLGCEVVRVWETIQPQPVAGLELLSSTVRLPKIRYGSLDNAAALVASLEAEVEQYKANPTSASRLHWAETRLERAQAVLKSWTTGVLEDPIEVELQAWRLGNLALVASPGEIFTQIGVRVKEGSPAADTFFVSCANDSIGYIPIAEAYLDGGYEVTHASKVDPEAAGLLTEGCLSLLHELDL